MVTASLQFSPLSIEHRGEIEKVTSLYEPYSDFNFTSLFGWNVDGSAQIANHNGNLVIKFPHYITGQPVVSMLGHNNVDETLEQLLTITDALIFVPQVVVDSIKSPEKFAIIEDIDGHDYLYSVQKIKDLTGKDYKKKRNKIHQALAEYGDQISVTTHDCYENLQEIEDVFRSWAKESQKHPEDTRAELAALKRVLRYAQHEKLLVTVVRVDGKICGFSVNELLDQGYAICHFEKVLPSFKNLTSYLAHVAVSSLYDYGCKVVNWEQDLGIEGLRRAKSDWKPDGFLKKYTITSAML